MLRRVIYNSVTILGQLGIVLAVVSIGSLVVIIFIMGITVIAHQYVPTIH